MSTTTVIAKEITDFYVPDIVVCRVGSVNFPPILEARKGKINLNFPGSHS